MTREPIWRRGRTPGPRVAISSASTRASSPSRPPGARTPLPGSDIDLRVPGGESPIAPTPSAIKDAVLTLPNGFSINSSAADGKTTCSAEQARIGLRHEAAQCPRGLEGRLARNHHARRCRRRCRGSSISPTPSRAIRIASTSSPTDSASTSSCRSASVEADPDTGRLTTRLEDLPQFPFNEFNVHLFGSERGLLATPDRCGTYAVDSTFTPWDSDLPEQTSTQFFELDEGPEGAPCPGQTRGFNPTFQAGVADRGAGVHSPFTFDTTRPDGDQNASGINVATPPGFTASLRGVPYCPEPAISQLSAAGYSGRAEVASPGCPDREPGRHGERRGRRRDPPGLRRRQGLSRRSVQGRAAEPGHRGSRGLRARTTLATSSSARRSTSTRKPRG